MKKTIVLLLVALALPTGVAFARPHHASGPRGKSAPKVMYVLKGTFSGYTAASAGSDGQVSIAVKHANFHGRALKNQTLVFTLSAKSRVSFRRGSHAGGQIAEGTKGYITVRAPKRIPGDLVTMLPSLATRIHVVVLKAPAS